MSNIDGIRELWRERQDHHREEKALTLRIKARLRRHCEGGDIAAADKLYRTMMAAGEADDLFQINARFLEARAMMEGHRKMLEKRLEALAKDLPVARFIEETKGVAMLSLAAIIGEAGDISNYETHSRLWKRMGLAVIGGRRQRRVSGAAAIEQGYVAARRSVMWNIGSCIIKAQSARIDKETGEVHKPAGPWREIYDERRAYEEAKNEAGDYIEQAAMALKEKNFGKTTAAFKAYSAGRLPPGHLHARAQRFMEKRLLRKIWQEWRSAERGVSPETALPRAA